MCNPGHKVLRFVRNLYCFCESRVHTNRLSMASLLLIRARITAYGVYIVCNLALRCQPNTRISKAIASTAGQKAAQIAGFPGLSLPVPRCRVFRNGSRVLQVIALPGPRAWNSEIFFQYTPYPRTVRYLKLCRAREEECIEMSFIVGDPRRQEESGGR